MHKQQQELVNELAATFNRIKVGFTYRHYKSVDKIYTVTGLAFLEATNELCVIYRAEYGARITFVRPLSVWLEKVEVHGVQVPRFALVEN